MENNNNNKIKILIGIIIILIIMIIVMGAMIFNRNKEIENNVINNNISENSSENIVEENDNYGIINNMIQNSKIQSFKTSVATVQHYIDKEIEKCEFSNFEILEYDDIFINGTCNVDVNSDILKYAEYEEVLVDLVIDSNNQIISAKGIGMYEGLEYPIER